MNLLIAGLSSLILCSVFYLIWWRAGFYPGVQVSRVTGKVGALLYITAALGLAGVILTSVGLGRIPVDKDLLPGTVVLIGAVAVYLILLFGTRFLFHRQVTTELALIVGWAALMVMAAGRVYAGNLIGRSAFTALLLITACAVIMSLYFYLAYYNVEPMRGFVYGMIPLITVGLSMLVFLVMLLAGRPA